MTGDRIVDAQGHPWPVTGDWCSACDWPLDAVHAAAGDRTHPACDPGPAATDAGHDRALTLIARVLPIRDHTDSTDPEGTA